MDKGARVTDYCLDCKARDRTIATLRLELKAERERANVMEHERDWEMDVVNVDAVNRAEAAERERDRLAEQVATLREALRLHEFSPGSGCYCDTRPIKEHYDEAAEDWISDGPDFDKPHSKTCEATRRALAATEEQAE